MQTTVGAALSVRLLGELDLRLGDTPLPPLESARAESLLAYLLIHRGAPQPRQRLAFLLWPDSSEQQARTNLRHVLHKLRRALPDADRYLDVGPRTLGWRPDAALRLDLAAFEDALGRADEAADPVEDLEAAVAAYAGDLLEGSYDEWLLEGASGCATATTTPSTACRACWRSAATPRGRSCTPSASCATSRSARGPAGC